MEFIRIKIKIPNETDHYCALFAYWNDAKICENSIWLRVKIGDGKYFNSGFELSSSFNTRFWLQVRFSCELLKIKFVSDCNINEYFLCAA